MKTRILAGLFAVAVGWFAVSAATPTGDVPANSAVADDTKPFGLADPVGGKYSAATTCSASGCHGNGQVGKKGGEYSTWTGDDPHRKAYAVLFNDASVRIQKNLHRDTPAHLDATCLKCHAVNEEKNFHGEVLEGRGLSEGVSCEACHGPSGAWLGEHFRDGWKQLSDREKFEKYGFKQTKDLVARTLACAQCHVGARDREVNHDMIAAGHPRLAFEAARFHFTSNYPKHWEEKIPNPGFELKLWAIGQVASLRQAGELLTARAERTAAKTAPWPELSESSCFGCHFDITKARNLATFGERGDRLTGRIGWQVWYGADADFLPQVAALIFPGSPLPIDAVKRLKDVMQADAINPTLAATVATAAVNELDVWLATVQKAAKYADKISPETAKAIAAAIVRHALTDDGKRLRDTDWDFLAQHTLGLAAAAHAYGDASKEWRPHVAKLQATLGFPAGKQGERYDSPRDYDVKAVLEHFHAIDKIVNRAGGER